MRISRGVSVASAVFAGLAMSTVTGGSAAAEITEEVVFSKTGDTEYGCYRIPAVLRAGNGDLLAFAEARNSPDCGDLGDIDLVMKRSTDNGRSWGDLRKINTGARDDWANPVPILDGDSGRIVLLSVHNPADAAQPRTPHVQYSDDNGQVWSRPRSLTSDLDLEWGHFATGPGGGIQLTRGAHAGRLVAGINFSVPDGGHGAGLIYSDDNGDSWNVGATDVITDGSIRPQELSLFERTDGGIYAAARENVNGDWQDPSIPTRAAAVSADGGATFDEPFAAVADLPGTIRVQGSVQRVRAGDTGDGYDRVVFATPTDGRYRKDMTVRSSFDEGRSWQSISEGTKITGDRAGYSDMELLADGRIGLLYEGGAYPDGNANDSIRFATFTEEDLGPPE